MKHTSLFLFFSLLLSLGHAQVITKLSNGNSTFYYNVNDLVAIVAAAAANDTIILPGGPINLDGSLFLDKKLTIIGAGIQNSGTPATGITTLIGTNVGGFQEYCGILATGAGSKFTGVNFQAPFRFVGFGNDAPSFSASFERCMFSSGFALSAFASPVVPPSAANVSAKHCIFLGGLSCSTNSAPQNLFIENCIIVGGLNFGASNIANAQVTQCLILNMTTSNGVNPGVVFSNNIFTFPGGTPTNLNSASTYTHNVFARATGSVINWQGAVDGGGNIGVSLSDQPIFVNLPQPSLGAYNEALDYHLSPAPNPARAMGLNARDAGIYDGPVGSPWKENAIPFNPHWVSLQPSLGTSTGGVINVNFSGAAQQD